MPVFHQRRLPHLHAIGCPVFLTWCLDGSLPPGRAFSPRITSGEAFAAMDRLLDGACPGPLYLERPEIARIVTNAILHGENLWFELHAWVVMGNHVHLLITPLTTVPKITKSLKGFTAREANRALGSSGRFWQQESYDRLVRNAAEFGRIKSYIEWNPVRAGIVAEPEEFPWSSAYRGELLLRDQASRGQAPQKFHPG